MAGEHKLKISDRNGKQKVLKYILQTFIILCALFVKFQVAANDGSELSVLVFLAKVRDSFYNTMGIELALGAGILTMYYYINKNCTARPRQLLVLSGVFSVLFIYCRSIMELGDGSFIFANSYQLLLFLFCFCGYWLLFHLVLRWVFSLLQNLSIDDGKIESTKKLWLISFIVLFSLWLPWIFASYPATFCSDSLYQLREFFGLRPWTTNSVPLSTAIMGLCVSLGELLVNRNFGVFIYIVMQSVAGAAVFAYLLVTIRRMGCGKGIYIGALLFYGAYPLMGAYAQWFEKDFLYVIFFALSMTLLVTVLWTRACSVKRAVFITLSVVLTSLLRNNGKFELLPFFFALCFVLKASDKKRLMVSLASVLLIVFSVNGILYPALGVVKIPASESLSIPFQQTARYVKFLPEEVTPEQKAAIAAVLDYDGMAEDYKPNISDPIKAKYHGDSESLKEYFKAWLAMGVRHPIVYMDAFVAQAYGYLSPIQSYGEPWVPFLGYTEYEDVGVSRTSHLIPTAMLDTWWNIMQRVPVLKLFATSGFYFWLALSCWAFLSAKKRGCAVLPLVPAVINFLLCVASPMSASIRYALQVAVTMPLWLWWTILNLSSKENK